MTHKQLSNKLDKTFQVLYNINNRNYNQVRIYVNRHHSLQLTMQLLQKVNDTQLVSSNCYASVCPFRHINYAKRHRYIFCCVLAWPKRLHTGVNVELCYMLPLLNHHTPSKPPEANNCS